MTAFEIFLKIFNSFEYVIIAYVGIINLIYFVMILLGFFALRTYMGRLTPREREILSKSPLLPSVDVIAPAYNEGFTIRESVRSMLSLRYPNHEVIVVNDGSKDDTLSILIEEYRLYKSSRAPSTELVTKPIRGIYESRDPIGLVVVDKENGGKSDAVNAGLNVSRAGLVAVIDSDSLLETESLLDIVKPFLEDPATIASGGIVRVVNECTVRQGRVVEVRAPSSLLARFQAVEYLRAFLGGRVAFSFLRSLLLISGAFGLFSRKEVLRAGGFLTATIGEDMELVVRLHRIKRDENSPYEITFVPEPVCWTLVPDKLRTLRSQRNRWQRGTVDVMRIHHRMLFNPRYGILGIFSLPYYAAFEMLGPTIELSGYVLTVLGMIFGLIETQIAVMFFIVSVLFGLLLSISSIVLEEMTTRRYTAPGDLARLLTGAVLENLGFRQLLTIWRTKALVDGFRGKGGWGAMQKRGFHGEKGGSQAG